MTTFAATHSTDVNSKAVDTVTYNENTKELVLDWAGALYKYSGVPLETYNKVVAGTYKNGLTDASVGRAAQRVKKDFGPGIHLGKFGEVTFVKDTTKVTGPTFPLAAQPATLASKTRISPSGTATATQTFSLTPSNVGSEPKASATYTVDWTVGGESYEYTPDGVTSVDEAVAAVREATDALGLSVVVKGVYVEFE